MTGRAHDKIGRVYLVRGCCDFRLSAGANLTEQSKSAGHPYTERKLPYFAITLESRTEPVSQGDSMSRFAPFLPSHPFLLSKTRLAREFEACQGRRRRVDIFRKCQHLKSPAEHFRVEQRLQRAFGFGRIR
jgi:hypothetical protein